MKKYATISADIVGSTTLSVDQRFELSKHIESWIYMALRDKVKYHIKYGRLTKGDYIELVIEEPREALRSALILKSIIKLQSTKLGEELSKSATDFKRYGVRVAFAIGALDIIDIEHDIIDGEAICMSGRAIEKAGTKTLIFANDAPQITAICDLLDFIFANMTAKQSEVIFWKLIGFNEKIMALDFQKSQSTIYQHLSSAGWKAIESALKYFETEYATN